MPQYVEVKGNVIEFPDGMAAGDIEKAITANMMSIKPAAAVGAGKEINAIPRQVGLTARYGLEGLANTAQLLTEPIRNAFANLASTTNVDSPLAPTRREMPAMMPLGQAATNIADAAGLPSPQGANERVIGDAARLVAGSGGLAAAGRAASAAPGLIGQVGEVLSRHLPQQLFSAGGAGLAGGASREAGGGAAMQTAAALAGGVGAGSIPGAINSVANTGRALLNRATMTPQQMDQQISVLLQRAEVDYGALPGAARNALREDLASALRAGQELDPQAVRRLADFRTVGATPTRGMVSQNPVQITREQNLAKMGANTSDEGLQGLALLQNRNNSTLIRNLNDAGAARGDPFRAGEAAIGGIRARDDALGNVVTGLYQQARDTSGRSLPLNGAAFTQRANQALDEAMLGGALPPDVANHMNRIARGEVPFTVDYAEQLKTRIAALQRATSDGSTRMALSTVRRALDDTPLVPANQVNPGNLPAVPGTVPPSPLTAGQESIDAFNRARAAARQRFAWQESGRPVAAALDGAQPDKFVQQFVIRGTVDDARSIAQNAPTEEVKNAIVAHLKERALNGAADEVGKFSQSAYNKALREIGERKLALFFSPEEIGQLNAAGRVASYAQVQPVGSAVNNSNSGAMLLGKGYDALMGLADRLPIIGPNLVPPIRNIEIGIRNQQAQNVLPGLLAPTPRIPIQERLLLPAAASGGLFAAPN